MPRQTFLGQFPSISRFASSLIVAELFSVIWTIFVAWVTGALNVLTSWGTMPASASVTLSYIPQPHSLADDQAFSEHRSTLFVFAVRWSTELLSSSYVFWSSAERLWRIFWAICGQLFCWLLGSHRRLVPPPHCFHSWQRLQSSAHFRWSIATSSWTMYQALPTTLWFADANPTWLS